MWRSRLALLCPLRAEKVDWEEGRWIRWILYLTAVALKAVDGLVDVHTQ